MSESIEFGEFGFKELNTWQKERLGKFTSSEIHRLLTEPKLKADKEAGNLSDGAHTYVLEKVAEILTGFPEYQFNSQATSYGVQLEHRARNFYESLKGEKVEDTSLTLISHPEIKRYGGSPDGLVGKDGALEIKCPFNTKNHLQHCLITTNEYFKSHFKEYYWQCMSNLFITGREWIDFVSYDPRVNHDCRFFEYRLFPNMEDFELLEAKVKKAGHVLEEYLTMLGYE